MFTHIFLFLRFLIRIHFLSVLAKRETTQLILEHPAEFPVHGHPGSGLTSLRTVLDRIFFFSKEAFLFFQATVPALHLGVSVTPCAWKDPPLGLQLQDSATNLHSMLY